MEIYKNTKDQDQNQIMLKELKELSSEKIVSETIRNIDICLKYKDYHQAFNLLILALGKINKKDSDLVIKKYSKYVYRHIITK
jgi:hypothetical protein